ncbi:MAG: type VI secretion system baseplate subunit TssG [bacterium]
MSNRREHVNERIRLTEFSLLAAVLGLDPADYGFVSREAQRSYYADIEAIRTETARVGNRQEQIATVYLPTYRDYFPDTFVTENVQESDHHTNEFEDANLKFWSTFDTTTYRFWIWFHILKLRMLLYVRDIDTEELYWARFGGDAPAVGREERRYLLLLRLVAPFFRGRRAFYERVLPAFIKKRVTVVENVPRRVPIPVEFRSKMGTPNAALGRSFCPGDSFVENYSTFAVVVNDLTEEDLPFYRPGGSRSRLLDKLLTLLVPANLNAEMRFRFLPDQEIFTLGAAEKRGYLGFSTYLRKTVEPCS